MCTEIQISQTLCSWCLVKSAAPSFILASAIHHLVGFVFFRCSSGSYLITSPICDSLRRWKGTLLYRRLAPWSPLVTQQPPALMKPTQVVCSGCRCEDSPLSLDVLFPGERCWLHVCFPSTLKSHIHLRPRGERLHAIWRYAGPGGQCYFETKCLFGVSKLATVVLVLLFIYFLCDGCLHSSQIKMFGCLTTSCQDW